MIAMSGPSVCQSVAKELFKERDQEKRNDSQKTEEYAESEGERSASTSQLESAKTKEGKTPNSAKPNDREVMISYSWNINKEIVEHIAKKLQEAGLSIWFDQKDTIYDICDWMANSMNNSKVILICFSELYCKSDNCMYEAKYAKKLKKKIVPVRMESNYTPQPGNWLDIIMGELLWYDLSTNENYKQNFPRLLNALGCILNELGVQKTEELRKAADNVGELPAFISQSGSSKEDTTVVGTPCNDLAQIEKLSPENVLELLESKKLSHLKKQYNYILLIFFLYVRVV